MAVVTITAQTFTGRATVTASTIRMVRSTVSVTGRATVTAARPIAGRTIGINPINARATSSVIRTTRMRNTERERYQGAASNLTASSFWHWKTVRANLHTSSNLEMYFVDHRDILQDIADYLPKYYNESLEVSQLTQTVGNEFIRATALAQDILNQFFPERATWGLARWERDFLIEVDTARPIEERRAEVIERIAGYYKLTLEILYYEARKFYDVIIDHNGAEQYIIIELTDMSITPSSDPVKFSKFSRRMISLIPCHLDIYIKTYESNWGELKRKRVKWGTTARYGWQSIRYETEVLDET